MTDVLPDHLGGFISGEHGDEATYFPDMWRWVVRHLDAKRVLDIGCGEGHALKYFRDTLGCKVVGIDGVPQDDPDIITQDYTQPGFVHECAMIARADYKFDLVWCCEFLEHIEEKYLRHMVTSHLMTAPVVLMTHAFPGQPGHHHVNCRDPEYWKGFFTGIGFRFDHELTRQTKLMARKNTHPLNHYVRSGMAFRNTQHETLFT